MGAAFGVLKKYRYNSGAGLERGRAKTAKFFDRLDFEDQTIDDRMAVLLSAALVICCQLRVMTQTQMGNEVLLNFFL